MVIKAMTVRLREFRSHFKNGGNGKDIKERQPQPMKCATSDGQGGKA